MTGKEIALPSCALKAAEEIRRRAEMEKLKKAYYRSFQAVFNLSARCLRWRRPIPVSGPGAIRKIPELLKREKVDRVMVVTGPTVGKKLAPGILRELDEAGIAYTHFDRVEANPSVSTVNRIQKLYLDSGCRGFIAIGGGSPMDAAKAAAARVVRPGTSLGQMAGLLKVGRAIPLVIAVPTTAGTGSETTIAAVITDDETHHKYALMDLHLVPKYAVLDPEMTRELPPKITSTTGMDALTHAVEAYLCWTYNTRDSIRLAEEAVCGIFRYLERAYRDGGDMEARTQMLIASYKAGFAFTRAGVGNVHAIAHTLGGPLQHAPRPGQRGHPAHRAGGLRRGGGEEAGSSGGAHRPVLRRDRRRQGPGLHRRDPRHEPPHGHPHGLPSYPGGGHLPDGEMGPRRGKPRVSRAGDLRRKALREGHPPHHRRGLSVSRRQKRGMKHSFMPLFYRR